MLQLWAIKIIALIEQVPHFSQIGPPTLINLPQLLIKDKESKIMRDRERIAHSQIYLRLKLFLSLKDLFK